MRKRGLRAIDLPGRAPRNAPGSRSRVVGRAERHRVVSVVRTTVGPALLIPTPVQRLGDDAELNDEVFAQIKSTMRLGLAALFFHVSA